MKSAWRFSSRPSDFIKRLVWNYSRRFSSPRVFTIGFTYPPPIGRCHLAVRANDGSDAFIHGEVFEHQCYSFSLASAPISILDLGANAGFAALFFSRRYPLAKIACVEPIENNLVILRKNLKLNNVNASVFAAAVGTSDGSVQMEINKMDYGHRVVEGTEIAAGNEQIQVRAMSIPSILRELGWARIGLLKIDIEGHEGKLLSNNCQWLELVDNICIECHQDFGQDDLVRLANLYKFSAPECLRGIWLLRR